MFFTLLLLFYPPGAEIQHILAPPRRTFNVPEEARLFVVPHENRILNVPEEERDRNIEDG